MRIFRALALILTSVLFFQCQRELSFIGGSDPQPALPAPITATVQGNILDENGLPADGVNIKVGTKTATTDAKGYFRITDASLDKNASLVVAERPGYYKAMRSFSATSGVNQVVIQLLPKTLAGTIDGTAGGSVTLNNGMKIALPANGVVNASGNTYTGSVNVYAAFIDPTSPEIDRIVPGSFMADDKNGGRVTLSSYGMMAVELESASGEKLQVKNGSKATLTSPIPASLQSSAPANIAMWYVDESKGIWKEEGSGVRNGNNYEGEVSHFSFWNYDISVPAVNISLTLVNDDGLPFVHTQVRIKTTIYQYPTFAYGYTDTLGHVSGLVPANQSLVMEVLDQCGNVIQTQNIGPFNQSTNLGNIVVTMGISTVTVHGTLLNCSGTPVTDGFVMLSAQNMVRYDATDGSGQFSISFVRCNNSPIDYSIVGIDNSTMLQGTVTSGTIINTTTDLGNITACGVNTSQFINYILDGTNYALAAPADSLNAYTYPDSISGFRTNIGGMRLQGGTVLSSIGLSFDHAAATSGNYTAESFSTQQYPQTSLNQPFAVNLTNYPASPGEYYEGSFTGGFTVGGTPHTVNGTFRIRRSF